MPGRKSLEVAPVCGTMNKKKTEMVSRKRTTAMTFVTFRIYSELIFNLIIKVHEEIFHPRTQNPYHL